MLSSPRLSSSRGRRLFVFPQLVFLCLVFACSLQAQQLSLPGLRAPVPDKHGIEDLPARLKAVLGEAPLALLYGELKVDPLKIRRLPELTEREKLETTTAGKRIRIGAVRELGRPLDVSVDGARYTEAGGEVSVMGVVSRGALLTRVHFTDVSLPAGARVFVYSLKNPLEFYGPYEGRGPSEDGSFWSPPVEGEGVGIEYFAPELTGASSSSAPAPFKVSEISHTYKSPTTKVAGADGGEEAAGACNLDVTGDWAEVAKSVGHLQFTSGGGEYLCTGTLLNNQANDQTPYLLTANHCFSTKAESQSLRVYWNYNSADFPQPGTPRTDGALLLSTSPSSDYTFVRLVGALPAGLYFSGWDATPTPVQTSVTGIHHPEGSYKRISFGSTISGCVNGLPGPCQNFTSVRWNSGTTELGSSGSGVWKGTAADPRFVGTLTGGLASCDTPSGADYYGSFSVTYQSISSYLTGAGGGGGGGGNCTAVPIASSQSVSDSLSSADCRSTRRPGSFSDRYSFDGSSGQQVEILMTASFDTYVYLIDPKGAVIAVNDDTPGSTNSRIGLGSVTLTTSGKYTIEATSYAPGATGGYGLSFVLQQAPTGPRFSQSAYSINEGDGRAVVVITRSANTASAEKVKYNTADGSGLNECSRVTGLASSRCDYATSFGILEFAPGETTKTFAVPLVDDAFAEGGESFVIFLGNAGGTGPSPSDLDKTTVTISDNDVATGSNQIDKTPFFIRQHYVDFLGREPDPVGYAGWQQILGDCPAGDLRCDRVEVSSAFFRSAEFQERGYFVYRMESVALGKIPTYSTFTSSLARVSGFLSPEQLEAAKAAYARDFLINLDFLRVFGGVTDPRQFVEAVIKNAGVTPAIKEELISDLANGKKTRDQVIRAIAESPEVYQKFFNEAFVVMQYFGFLRRDPDILYLEWIKTMNETGNYRTMIDGFMNSQEYRQRFGP